MIYKLTATNSKYDTIEPMAFTDFSSFGHLEKDLEALIADHILDVLFEDSGLMPIFQERQYRAEADIYALNKAGELVIFELKRATAGSDAVLQALRYAQTAGQWTYAQIEERYQTYTSTTTNLCKAHQEAFGLEHELSIHDINKRQHLLIIGSAADDPLINSIDYWKRQGISIDFLPYRIYELNGEKYFEFFAPPYDRHMNVADAKGVLFDTNRSYDEESIWYMIENDRVAAFGEAKRFIHYLNPGDIVFYSHKWTGLVAAAKVKKGIIKSDDGETLYRDVEFLTKKPIKGAPIKALSFAKTSEITGKSFFWARTIKVPYLTKAEADMLVTALQAAL
jgi:hypothetical protein